MNYYPIPVNLAEIIEGKDLNDRIDLRKSIHQNIRLILKSFVLSYRYDPSFGSTMNKYQAATPPQKVSDRAWKNRIQEDIRNNLKDVMQRYETRIRVDDVLISLNFPKKQSQSGVVNVSVTVKGELTLGRKEKFHYPDSEVEEDAQELFPLLIPIGKAK